MKSWNTSDSLSFPRWVWFGLVQFVFLVAVCVVYICELWQQSVKHTLSLLLAKWCVTLWCSVGI